TTSPMNIAEPEPPPGEHKDGRILLSELPGFTFGVTGELDIAGLTITPEFAGMDLPGRIDIFTTTDVPTGPVDINTPRGPVLITSLDELKRLSPHIQVVGSTSFDDFSTMTPGQIVTLFIQLGNTLQDIARKLNVPQGIPFVSDAVTGIVSFVDTLQGFARQLYFSPRLIAPHDITVT